MAAKLENHVGSNFLSSKGEIDVISFHQFVVVSMFYMYILPDVKKNVYITIFGYN